MRPKSMEQLACGTGVIFLRFLGEREASGGGARKITPVPQATLLSELLSATLKHTFLD